MGSRIGVAATPIWLRAEQGQGHHCDAVSAAVGGGSGGDDDEVDAVIAEFFFEPVEVSHVAAIDGGRELHLDTDNTFVAFDDEVDLVTAALGSEMGNVGVSSLCCDPNRQCCQ